MEHRLERLQNGSSSKARGRVRMEELAAEAARERQAEADKLLASLGHAPSGAEEAIVEQCAALIVRARRLRSYGREGEALECSRLLHRLMRQLGDIAHKGSRTKPKPTFLERLREAAR